MKKVNQSTNYKFEDGAEAVDIGEVGGILRKGGGLMPKNISCAEAIEAESNTPAPVAPVALVDAEVEELKNELKWREYRLARAKSSARLMAERLDKAVRQLAEAKEDLETWDRVVAEREETLKEMNERLEGLLPISARDEEVAEAHARTVCGGFGVGVED